MAGVGGNSVGFVLVDGFDVRSTVKEITPTKVTAITDESTVVGDSWPSHKAIVRRGYFATKGFYDDAAGSINAAISGLEQVRRVVCVAFEGNTIGKKFDGLAGAIASQYERLINRGKLHLANVTYDVSGEADLGGIILQNLALKTATGDTEGADSQDAGALSNNGGAGYLQVTAISGTGATLDAKVRHSADDVTYADLVTFTQVVLADVRKAQRVAVSGTVNRHLAASWAIAGSSPNVTFMVGFKREP
jgi:hypothetical protein